MIVTFLLPLLKKLKLKLSNQPYLRPAEIDKQNRKSLLTSPLRHHYTRDWTDSLFPSTCCLTILVFNGQGTSYSTSLPSSSSLTCKGGKERSHGERVGQRLRKLGSRDSHVLIICDSSLSAGGNEKKRASQKKVMVVEVVWKQENLANHLAQCPMPPQKMTNSCMNNDVGVARDADFFVKLPD
jgi:hypothetical protein